jgi:hypothetical protein
VERPAVSLIAKLYRLFQIVDTPESSEAMLNTVLVGAPQQTNRTVVKLSPHYPLQQNTHDSLPTRAAVIGLRGPAGTLTYFLLY